MAEVDEAKRLHPVPLTVLVGVLCVLVMFNWMAGFAATTGCTSEDVPASDCDWINMVATLGMIVSFVGAGVTLALGFTDRRKAVPAFFVFLAAGVVLAMLALSG